MSNLMHQELYNYPDKQEYLIWDIMELKVGHFLNLNKTKVISADLLNFDFDLDLDSWDIFKFCDISDLVAFQFWWQFQFW